MLLGTGSFIQFMSAGIHPISEFDVIRMIFVSHAKRGQPPRVFQFGIEGKAVVFDRQRSAMAENLHSAIEAMCERCLEVLAPARRVGRESAERKPDGSEIEARVEAASPVESNLIVIELIKIVKDATDGVAFVIVERILKLPKHGAAAIKHQILPHEAARVGQAVRELLVGREQEQARSLRSIRAN